MSLRFLDEAGGELEVRRRRQAQENLWVAIVHQLSAIAEQRGWNHEHEFFDIGRYLEKEYNLRELVPRLSLVEGDYVNFFGIEEFTSEIRREIARARQLIAGLENLRQCPMRPYTIEDRCDRAIVYNLTGATYPVGTTREPGS